MFSEKKMHLRFQGRLSEFFILHFYSRVIDCWILRQNHQMSHLFALKKSGVFSHYYYSKWNLKRWKTQHSQHLFSLKSKLTRTYTTFQGLHLNWCFNEFTPDQTGSLCVWTAFSKPNIREEIKMLYIYTYLLGCPEPMGLFCNVDIGACWDWVVFIILCWPMADITPL